MQNNELINEFIREINSFDREEDYNNAIKCLNELTELLKKAERKNLEVNLYEYLPTIGYNIDDVFSIVELNNGHIVLKENLTDLLDKFKNK